MDELYFAQMSLSLERKLMALVDPIHDTRLWDEHLTRIERLRGIPAFPSTAPVMRLTSL